jgi:hypothetical protein
MDLQKLTFNTLGICLSMLLILGCGGKKLSEQEQYDETRDSFKYTTYKALSEGSLGLIVTGYNKTLGSDSLQLKEDYIRVLLGYYWAVSDSPSFAFAEADILSAKKDPRDIVYMASMLNSCTMYQQGWTGLAKTESDKGIALAATNGDQEKVANETMIFHLVLGTVCMQQRNYEAAKFHFAGFGQLSGVEFPYKLADIICDIQRGHIQGGLQKAKKLAKDPAVPEILRTELTAIITTVEAKGGDVDSSLFWPKAISSLIIDQMKESSNESVRKLMGLMDIVIGKLG